METAVAENRISELGSSHHDFYSLRGFTGAAPVHHHRLLDRHEGETAGIINYPIGPGAIALNSRWLSEEPLALVACTPSEVIHVSRGFEGPIGRTVFLSYAADDKELEMTWSAAFDAFHKAVLDVQEENVRIFQTQPTMHRLTNVYSPPPQPNLEGALNDLAEIESEAQDAGYAMPSSLAVSGARYVVQAMHRIRSLRYHIYPMPDGEIAIDGGERGTRIGVFCYPDGEVQYVGWVNGECVEEQSSEARQIPSDFLRRALSELEDD